MALVVRCQTVLQKDRVDLQVSSLCVCVLESPNDPPGAVSNFHGLPGTPSSPDPLEVISLRPLHACPGGSLTSFPVNVSVSNISLSVLAPLLVSEEQVSNFLSQHYPACTADLTPCSALPQAPTSSLLHLSASVSPSPAALSACKHSHLALSKSGDAPFLPEFLPTSCIFLKEQSTWVLFQFILGLGSLVPDQHTAKAAVLRAPTLFLITQTSDPLSVIIPTTLLEVCPH